MRVLYHHRTQGREVEAVHIKGLAGGLEQLGYEVEILGPPGVRSDADSRASNAVGKPAGAWSAVSRWMPQGGFELMELAYNLVALPRLLAACRRTAPAFIYERYALYNFAGVAAGLIAGIPVVIEVNDTAGMDRTRQGKRLVMPGLAARLERWIFRRANGIAPVSGYLRDRLLDEGVPPGRMVVTPNAVDSDRFDPDRADGSRIRNRHGLGAHPVIGFAGCFAKWHGVELLIEAAASLSEEMPQLRLLLVGDGPRRSAAEALAGRLGLGERAMFTGRVPHSAIPDHIAAMDIGVMPASNPFGSPVKVFEYMAMARAAVGPRHPPLKEAIDDGITGLLFEPDSCQGLAECLRSLLHDPDLRRRMGAAGRRKVLDQHLWVHNARAVEELAKAASVSRGRPARAF